MRDMLESLLQAVRSGIPVAYCRLVETRGSTPQKAGAAMLVFPSGEQVGTLGGGCVEAEVKRRAQSALVSARPAIYSFQLDHDYGWGDGLICGGRMQIAVHPVSTSDNLDYLETFLEELQAGRGVTEVIQFRPPSVTDETPCVEESPENAVKVTASDFAPAFLLLNDAGEVLSQLNAPSAQLTAQATAALVPLSDRPRPYARQGLAFLPMLARPRLLIVGGGHVGHAVAQLAAQLDFEIWVADDRTEFVTAERFPEATQRMSGELHELLSKLEVTPDTYCLIVTRGHQHDEEALSCLANRGARYVGMIGSRRKIRLIFEDLLLSGYPAEALQQVHAPVGIDIGSQTVAEIAVSICAELVSFRNRLGVVPGRPESVTVAWE